MARMYRRPKFLELLIDIRLEMAREADYDVDLFTEMARSGRRSKRVSTHSLIEHLSGNAKKIGSGKAHNGVKPSRGKI